MKLFKQCALFSLQAYCFDYGEYQAINFSSESDIQASVITTDKNLFVVFRGTETEADYEKAPFWTKFKDWFVNLSFKMVKLAHGVKVHGGYYHSLCTIFGALVTTVNKKIGKRKLIITGHSAGGAYARLFQYMIKNNYPNSCAITFGEPRGGNYAYVEQSDKLVNIRIINECDPVPFGPPLFLGYRHSKYLLWLSEKQKRNFIPIFVWLKTLFQSRGIVIKDHDISEYLAKLS